MAISVSIHSLHQHSDKNIAQQYHVNLFSDSFNSTITEVKENLDQVDKLNKTIKINTLDINLLKFSVGGTMFKMNALEEGISKNLKVYSKSYVHYACEAFTILQRKIKMISKQWTQASKIPLQI